MGEKGDYSLAAHLGPVNIQLKKMFGLHRKSPDPIVPDERI